MHNIRVLLLYKLTMIICVHGVYGSMIVMVMHVLVCTVCDTLYAKKMLIHFNFMRKPHDSPSLCKSATLSKLIILFGRKSHPYIEMNLSILTTSLMWPNVLSKGGRI